MAFTTVIKHSNLPENKGVCVQIGQKKVALFRVGSQCYALEDNCTHRDVPLSLGSCTATEAICPIHGAKFDLVTGAALTEPATKPVQTYPVKIIDDDVLIDVEPQK